MKFLNRKGPSEPAAPPDAGRIVHREIEISVHREWVSVATQATCVSTQTHVPPVVVRPGHAALAHRQQDLKESTFKEKTA
jgi:hypothetical protein